MSPPATLMVSLDTGYLDTLETLVNARPPLADPNRLTWHGQSSLGPVSYMTFDQQADDVARNQLFAIAIFLGTAAACLVAAMQSPIRQRHHADDKPAPPG